MVINVVGNDFDESLAAYKRGPGFWLYAPDETGTLRLRLSEHNPEGVGLIWLARHSALLRYLVVNLHLVETLGRLRAIGVANAARRAMPATRTRQPIKNG